jgi:CcmD family protein
MGAWGFVALAYGIVWSALIIYWISLRKRMHKAEAKLAQLEANPKTARHA